MSSPSTKTPKSARKAKGDGHLRRAEILEAAERIFVAEGYEGATIRKIADEVGVSSTALYMHFQDKSGILLEICERTLRRVLDCNREIAARPLDPADRLRAMMETYIRWGLEHPNAYQLVYGARDTAGTPWPEGVSALARESYDVFAAVVRELKAAERLRFGGSHLTAQALWLACHGLVALLTARPTFEWVGREDLINATLDGALAGHVKA